MPPNQNPYYWTTSANQAVIGSTKAPEKIDVDKDKEVLAATVKILEGIAKLIDETDTEEQAIVNGDWDEVLAEKFLRDVQAQAYCDIVSYFEGHVTIS